MHKIVVGILLDETICRLSMDTKRKSYVHKEINKIVKKHYKLAKADPFTFNNMYKVASDSWIATQRKFMGKKNDYEFSTVLIVKFLIEKEPWLINYFKLNMKHINKLENIYKTDKHIFRSAKLTNEMLKQVDIAIAHYLYNLD